MINRNIFILSELALNEKLKYGSFIYELIKYNMYFPYIISSLDQSEVTSSSNNNIQISANQQLLHLLDKLINEFDKYFPMQYGQRYDIVGKLLGLNLTIEYLHSKYYYEDKEYELYYEDMIKKIFITIFYSNLKYNYKLYSDIFSEKRINYTNIDLNKPLHVKKILNILSDLSYCNLTNDITWLFEDIESHIIRDKNSSYRKKQKSNKECEERIISINNKYVIKLIENYNMRKEYLKYFR